MSSTGEFGYLTYVPETTISEKKNCHCISNNFSGTCGYVDKFQELHEFVAKECQNVKIKGHEGRRGNIFQQFQHLYVYILINNSLMIFLSLP